jgi:D-alanyl-D-alanine carboxypeptidase/D-alanyl-D-alanine-endopeptidase (penicillin-binding protein 4)
MLCSSDNLTSEIAGTLASKESSNRNKNSSSGVEIFFRRSFPSISWEEFRMDNYSGLTDTNRATPEQTVAMLIYLSRFEQQSKEQNRLLPLSGLDGTMKSKLDDSGTAFRIYAKTGSIYYASALAGDFIAASGKKYLFAVFIDNKVKRRQY